MGGEIYCLEIWEKKKEAEKTLKFFKIFFFFRVCFGGEARSNKHLKFLFELVRYTWVVLLIAVKNVSRACVTMCFFHFHCESPLYMQIQVELNLPLACDSNRFIRPLSRTLIGRQDSVCKQNSFFFEERRRELQFLRFLIYSQRNQLCQEIIITNSHKYMFRLVCLLGYQ